MSRSLGSLIFDRWYLGLISILVPGPRRSPWLREWRSELWHMRFQNRRTNAIVDSWRKCLSLAYGVVADAACLRMEWLQVTARGSAGYCLALLLFLCVLCASLEFFSAGSWHSLRRNLVGHFWGCVLFGALPAIFVAAATALPRRRKCNRKRSFLAGRLPLDTRWFVFLGAKVSLTLLLGFLSSVVIVLPLRYSVGHSADWAEVLMATVLVSSGLRWAFLDQELRCHTCLRLLSQPARVGAPTHNLLDWNGTELACDQGHGMLHVPEMRGSWCWFDLWVELDATWQVLFCPQSYSQDHSSL
jgi:hypothetical protein